MSGPTSKQYLLFSNCVEQEEEIGTRGDVVVVVLMTSRKKIEHWVTGGEVVEGVVAPRVLAIEVAIEVDPALETEVETEVDLDTAIGVDQDSEIEVVRVLEIEAGRVLETEADLALETEAGRALETEAGRALETEADQVGTAKYFEQCYGHETGYSNWLSWLYQTT